MKYWRTTNMKDLGRHLNLKGINETQNSNNWKGDWKLKENIETKNNWDQNKDKTGKKWDSILINLKEWPENETHNSLN